MTLRLPRGTAILLTLALATAGCAGRWAYRQGQVELRKGNWDLAVARLSKALEHDPDNLDYKIALENARIHASREHYKDAKKQLAAEELDRALEELDIASKFDPANQAFALERDVLKDKIRRRDDERRQRSDFDEAKRRADAAKAPIPMLSPRSQDPISLNFPEGSLQKIFDTLGQLTGVNVLYDEQFRDKQVNVKLTDVTFQEALDQLVFVHGLFYKVVDANTIIIVPEGAQKRRKYDEQLMRTFYLQNADPNQFQNTLRQLLQVQGPPPKIVVNQELRAITVMGNADELALAAMIVEAHDKPLGEVMVEVEILDVSRTALKHYGIELANYEGSLSFAPFGEPSGSTSIRAHLLSSLNLADFVVNIPSQIFYRFLQTDSTARILASPRLRGGEGKQTQLRIGTEVPIPVTTFTAQSGNGGNFAPATSFQYRNVGINMQLTPKVNAHGEITFDPLAAEFSLIGADRDVGGIKAPEFLTRNVQGVLRVRDGETALIGGLLQGSAREAFTGIIGVQSVPLLNRLLTSPNKSREDSEILISITPHIVRGPKLSDRDLATEYVGRKELIQVPKAHPPLFGPAEEPAATPAPTPAASSTPAPVGAVQPSLPPGPAPIVVPPVPGPGPAAVVPSAGPGVPADAPSVMVLFNPPETSMRIGEVTSVSVVTLRVSQLVSVDLSLTYDGAALEAQDVEPGSLLTLDGATVASEKNLEPGRVRARLSRPTPTEGPGAGAVATIRFKGLTAGRTSVAIESLSLTTPAGRVPVTLPGPGSVVVLP